MTLTFFAHARIFEDFGDRDGLLSCSSCQTRTLLPQQESPARIGTLARRSNQGEAGDPPPPKPPGWRTRRPADCANAAAAAANRSRAATRLQWQKPLSSGSAGGGRDKGGRARSR